MAKPKSTWVTWVGYPSAEAVAAACPGSNVVTGFEVGGGGGENLSVRWLHVLLRPEGVGGGGIV